METIFLAVLNRGLSASWLILAVLLLRLLLKKAPKWVRGLLWGLAALRLISPVPLESALALLPGRQVIPAGIAYAPVPAISTSSEALNGALNPVIADSLAPTAGASVNPMQMVLFAASYLWLCGAGVLLGYALLSTLRLNRKLRTSRRERGEIWISPAIDTPFLFGLMRPRMVLPERTLPGDRPYILLHEAAHQKRGDHWRKLLGFLILAVYWFHPLIWLAYALFCRDLELAADEYAIRSLTPSERIDYSQALLNCSRKNRRLLTPVGFAERGTKERIRSILSYRRPPFWILLISAVFVLAAAVFLLPTSPGTQLEPQMEAFLRSVILEDLNTGPKTQNLYNAEHHEILGLRRSADEVTIYAWILTRSFDAQKWNLFESGGSGPAVIRIRENENSLELLEYWTPGDGPDYAKEIRERFPLMIRIFKLSGMRDFPEVEERMRAEARKYFASAETQSAAAPYDASYYYVASGEVLKPSLRLNTEAKTAEFTWAALSSQILFGSYSMEGDTLTLTSGSEEIGGESKKAVFHRQGDDFLFDLQKSSPLSATGWGKADRSDSPLPDGALFSAATLSQAYFDAYGRARFDLDGDGVVEDCYMGYGGTSGVFTFTFTAAAEGKVKYYDVFISEFYELSFAEKDGRVQVHGKNQAGEIHEYEISAEDGRIVLTRAGAALPKVERP